MTAMPSFNPSTVSIESFDSLDASGGRFTFKCAAFDYSAYTELKLKVKLTQGSDVEEGSIDICGNSFMPTLNKTSTVEYLMAGNSPIAHGRFTVEAFIEGKIDIDSSANVLALRTYGGAKASRTYIKDKHMLNPVVTLSNIDWVSGTQTVKAVVADGSFANLTFVFDLSGSVASTTQYDICNTTLTMTATKEYSYATLKNYPNGVRVSVSASRPEVNGGATRSVTEKVQMAVDLKAIKRAPAPVVDIDLLYGGVGGATLTFANIDLSYTSVEGVISQGENQLVSVIDDDASGAEIVLSSGSLTPGNRYLVSGYSRLNLTNAGYAARYTELNESVDLRSIATSSQYVYSGTPTIRLSYRPRDASTNMIDTVRLAGDKAGNNVTQLMAFARDVSGHLHEATLPVGPETTDSCGNRLFHAALVDRTGGYTHDFKFAKSLELSDESKVAIGILDIPSASDAITTVITNLEQARSFVEKANAYNTALSEYTVALDLSSNPTKDKVYQGHVTAIANYDISINDLSNAILGHMVTRDGSNNGSTWFKNHKIALHELEVKKANVAINNTLAVSEVYRNLLAQLVSLSDASDVELQLTQQTVVNHYLTSTNDPSYQTIKVPKYPDNATYYNAESALAHRLDLAKAAQTAAQSALNSAFDAKDAAILAHTNNGNAITDKGDLKTAAISGKATSVDARIARHGVLVDDAGAKKVVLYGRPLPLGPLGRVNELKAAHALFPK